MKHIFISLFLSGSLFSVYAQNDSLNKTPVIRDSTPVTTNNTMNNVRNDSTGSVNNAMKSDSTASMNTTMKTDSTANMNNTTRTDSTGSVNNNSNINNTTTNTQSNVSSSTSNSNQMTPAFPGTTNTSMINNIQNIPGLPGYASLPVLESYVPADVVSKVKSKYNYVYDITPIKHTTDQTAYVVRHLDNGVYKTEIMGEDGNVIQ